MSAERVKAVESEKGEGNAIPVVRVIPVTFKSAHQLRRDLDSGMSLDSINFTRVILAEKSKVSKASAGLIMPLGGKCEEGETVRQAAGRKVREESLIFPMGQFWEKEEIFQPIDGFSYKIKGKGKRVYNRPRAVSIQLMLVHLPEMTWLRPRNPDTTKISDFKSLSPEEFCELIECGRVDRKLDETGKLSMDGEASREEVMAGHFTKIRNPDDIEIGDSEKKKRSEVLGGVQKRVMEFEIAVRNQVLLEVNRRRLAEGKETVSEFSDCNKSEILGAFQRLQVEWMLEDERAREADYITSCKKVIDKYGNGYELPGMRPPPGIDLLKYAWYLSARGVETEEMFDHLLEAPTRNVRNAMREMFFSFRRAFIDSETSELRKKIEDLRNSGDSRELEDIEEELRKKSWKLRRSFSLDSIRAKLESLKPGMPRFEYLKKLDAAMLSAYARRISRNQEFTTPSEKARNQKLNEEQVLQVLTSVSKYFQYLYDQSLALYPENKLFQPNKLVNDVVNAGLAKLFLLALGINPYAPDENAEEVDPIELKKRKYEALRSVAFVMHGVPAYERYRELFDNGSGLHSSIFDGLIFTSPSHTIGKQVDGRLFQVTHRMTRFEIGGRKQHVTVDVKPPKPFESFLRKSYFEALQEIFDVFSMNIVITEEEGEEGYVDIGSLTDEQFDEYARDKVDRANELCEEIQNRFKENVAGGWSVRIISDKNTFHQLEKTPGELRAELAQRGPKGKRAGSMADFIIRRKFYVVINDKENNEYAHEVIVYPFETFENCNKYRGILWGHSEKIMDDATGGYGFRRLLEQEPEFPEGPVFFNLLFPPHLYQEQAKILWFSETANEEDGRGPNPFLMLKLLIEGIKDRIS